MSRRAQRGRDIVTLIAGRIVGSANGQGARLLGLRTHEVWQAMTARRSLRRMSPLGHSTARRFSPVQACSDKIARYGHLFIIRSPQ